MKCHYARLIRAIWALFNHQHITILRYDPKWALLLRIVLMVVMVMMMMVLLFDWGHFDVVVVVLFIVRRRHLCVCVCVDDNFLSLIKINIASLLYICLLSCL